MCSLDMQMFYDHVYILLHRDGDLAAVSVATCECAAG